MEASNIFTDTVRELRYGRRRLIHQGGQSSGKTVNILASLATMCSEESSGVTTVTSMSMPHLKGGALRDFEMYVYPEFKDQIEKYHKTDHLFTFNSGALLEFKVYENEMAARGQKRKRLFVNEANSFDWMTFFQLDTRSEQTIIDYNPSIRFWSHENLIGKDGNLLLISDHRHNPFLSKQKHAEIEAFRDITKKDGGELFKVYSRGLTGNVTGVIFPNWDMIDEADFPQDEDYVFGIDFGYTNDPTAIVKICRVANTIYIKECAYETGLAPISIYQILIANGFNNNCDLFCEHDPDMVFALRHAGLPNADLARKGQGSVNRGIELLNEHKVVYTNNSTNLHRERSMYIWDTDKVTGKQINKPVDRNNHLMDAIRYAAYTKYLREV